MNRRILAGGAGTIIAVGLIGGLTLWPHAQAQDPAKDAATAASRNDTAPRLPISVIPVRTVEAANAIRLTGQVEAYRVAAVAAEVADRVQSRPMYRGDHVTAGQTIALLNDDLAVALLHQAEATAARAAAARRQAAADYARAAVETQAAVSQAKAQLETAQAAEAKSHAFTRSQELAQAESALTAAQAEEALDRKDYERYETLLKEGAIPQQTLDRAKTALDAAVAKRESADEAVSLAKEGARREDIAQAAAQVSVARAGLESANARPERLAVLKMQIEALQAQEKEAQAGVEQARIALGKRRIVAPFDGRVLETLIEPGEMLSPGRIVLRLADVQTIKAVFALPETMRPSLRPGIPVSLTADSMPGRTFMGRIKVIGYEADHGARTFPVEIAVTNPDEALLPGMVVRLAITPPAPEGSVPVAIPVAAVASDGTTSYVFRIENGHTRQQTVTLGEPAGNDNVEIISGLHPGDRIAATPQRLTDGAAVEIMSPTTPEAVR